MSDEIKNINKIYHGTSICNLKKILDKGIVPRGTKGSTNWEKNPSHPEMVYLSTAYPFYFAYCSSQKSDKYVVFEIDFNKLDPKKLYPDEDFIYNAIKDEEKPELSEIRKFLTNPEYQKYCYSSLYNLGNICFRGKIPVDYITRYCIVDFKERSHLSSFILDPVICIMNYRFLGKKYEKMIRWFFGDEALLPQVDEVKEMSLYFDGIPKDSIDFWINESKNRKGIKVIDI